MGFFNDIGKKTSEATSKIAKETKLKMKINENKGKIKELYEEIGKKVYEKHVREEYVIIKEELAEECDKLRNRRGKKRNINIKSKESMFKMLCRNRERSTILS